MAKPKIDVKQILLQRGERIGVSVAGILTLLLILLGLLWPGKGLFSGSAAEKAKSLTEAASFINAKLSDPNNQPTEADKPGDSRDKKVALEMNPVNAKEFALAPLIPSIGSGKSLGRRPPTVLDVEEGKISLVRIPTQAYIINPDGTIATLEPADGASSSPGTGTKAGAGKNRRQNMFTGSRGSMTMGGPGGRPPGGMGAGMGGMKGFPGGMGGLPGRMDRGSEGDKKARNVKNVPPDKLSDSDELAEQVLPVRMAIIAASFPYKKEVEEFRNKLGLPSDADVLAENLPNKGKGRPVPSFRFLGVDLERRELDGDGKPIGKGEYTPVDWRRDIQPYIVSSGRRFEPEDPDMKPIIFRSLAMPRLMQFRPANVGKAEGGTSTAGGAPGGGGMVGPRPGGAMTPPGGGAMTPPGGGSMRPPGGVMLPPGGRPGSKEVKEFTSSDLNKDQYPNIERSLPKLAATLEALKGKNPAEVAKPPERFREIDNIFEDPEDAEAPAEGTGTGLTTGKGGTGSNAPAATEIPDYCLVRALDVTVEPGKSYEYRIRIRMANPNYNRPDVASVSYLKEKELKTDWSKITFKLTVDPELHYYAVDQKELDALAASKKGASPSHSDEKVVLQAHRWLPVIKLPNGTAVRVGEWVVAERFTVARGDYVGRTIRVPVPYWDYRHVAFAMANDNSRGSRAKPEIGVDFGYNAGQPIPEAIAVDITSGGKVGIEKVTGRNEEGQPTATTKVTDESGTELLMLAPNGRLLLLEGALEAHDPERVDRVAVTRQRIKDVAEAKKGSAGEKTPGGGGNLGS